MTAPAKPRTAPPPCTPDTLGARCAGDCGRTLHARGSSASKRVCDAGHPVHQGHGRCAACLAAYHRADRPAPDMGWQERAACRGVELGDFFPDVQAGVPGGAKKATEHVAWRWRHPCPVRDACGGFADQTRSVGLWGGAYRRWQGSSYTSAPVIPAAKREAS